MFQSKAIDVAAYIVARSKDGKLSATTDAKHLLQELGGQERVELSVIVGDARFEEGILWNLGTIRLDVSLLKDTSTTDLPLPRRLHDNELKPEIKHLFVHSSSNVSICECMCVPAPTGYPTTSDCVSLLHCNVLWSIGSMGTLRADTGHQRQSTNMIYLVSV